MAIKIPESSSGIPPKDVENNGVTIWPIPASNILNMQLDSDISAELNLQIRDIGGRLIQLWKMSESQTQLDISDLKPGVYMLILSGKENKEVRKFIKR
jgi:hypothetical protein